MLKSRVRLLAALLLVALVSRPVAAQSIKDFVAWAAMMSSPYGSLAPVVTGAMAGDAARTGSRASSFELRYGQFSFDPQSPTVHTEAVGARFGALGLVLGYQSCKGCDGGVIAGADYEAIVVTQRLNGNGATSLFTLGLRPAVGFGRSTGGGSPASTIVATMDMPIAVAVPITKTAKMVPFVSPGFGVGAVRANGDHQSGTRGALGFGAAVVGLAPGLGVNLGWRKVFLKDAPSTFGVGLTFSR